ncbi:MAG: response regulator [Alphaproteobacteria bacterium]|nr:response regulator [Alphaproteobacteria bacterium]
MVAAPARVLLIEDDALDQSLFRRTLAKTRADIVCAGTLEEGLARLRAGGFDLVVSDLGLPDSEWDETYDRLKAASDDVPVVLITGHQDFVDRLGGGDGHQRPYVFLKSSVHHDIFPLVALGRMLEHLIDAEGAGDA